MTKILFYSLLLTFFISCNSKKEEKNHDDVKIMYLKTMVNKLKAVDLPFRINCDQDSLKTLYASDLTEVDTVIFEKGTYKVLGYLPDTSNYFGLFFKSKVRNLHFVSFVTIGKDGNMIDKKRISAYSACGGGHPAIKTTVIYDSICIDDNLRILTETKIVGPIGIDSIYSSEEVCQIIRLSGFFESSGKINLQTCNLIDCKKK